MASLTDIAAQSVTG